MMDMAIGIIIGGAFGKIIASLVSDIIMPPLGALIGGVDFTELKMPIKGEYTNEAGEVVAAVTLNYGSFIQASVDFLIIALVIFMVIKTMNRLKKKEEAKPEPPPAVPPVQEQLLAEIRDLLKEGKKS